MEFNRRTFLGTVTAAALGLAGCANSPAGDGATDTTAATETTTAEATATDTSTGTATMSATVQVRSHPDLGDILVDAEGMTLYMFDQDTQGEGASTCSGGCADAWPPLTVDETPTAGGDVTAELTTFERADGSMHVAANGWPLYYFARDESAGDANGQGANDVWWVLRPDGSPVRPAMGTTSTPTPTANGYNRNLDP